MKKILTVLLLMLCLVLSLTGCGMRNKDMNDIGSDIESQKDRITSGIDSALDGTMGDNLGGMQSDNIRITEEQAKKTALEHAGVSESDARGLRAELDRDDGALHYDVEFTSGTTEYDYDIHAETGEIISHDRDIDD